jgi:exo-beta-1,3-glucanase (GH17 family)
MRVLTLAGKTYPQMKFQLGIGLQTAPSTCINSANSDEIARGVALANQFDNVAAVSVGNEPANLPVHCLAMYLSTARGQVTQPITTNDIAAIYMGSTDAQWAQLILPLLDFASIHIYPFWELGWNWQQTGVAAGPARAQAMMAASVAYLKDYYQQVQQFVYQNESGYASTIAATLPIVIGETGWKARVTRPLHPIENHAANPVNQKWYVDLLTQWEATGIAPKIIYFVGFDEAWKGTDDGWGLWSDLRVPRYALCGTSVPSAPVCHADVYSGAGYFQ